MEDNTAAKRFELEIDGHIVFADYRLEGNMLYINHVEAPEALRGSGAASKLMQEIADKAKAEQLSIIPICSYAASWIRRETEPTQQS